MNTMVFLRRAGSSLAVLAFGCWAAPALGDSYNARGFYVGAAAAYNTISGGFDGTSYFNSGDEVMLVPKLKGAMGWGVALGWRWSSNAIEAGYYRSVHEYTFQGTALSTASANLVNISFKHFYGTARRLQPYFNIDLGCPVWLSVDQGSYSTSTARVNGNVSYWGLVLGGGGGLAFQATPQLAVRAGAAARMVWITDLYTGAGAHFQVSGFSAFNPAVEIGVTYIFKR